MTDRAENSLLILPGLLLLVLAFFVPQKFRKTINAGLCGCLPKWMHLPEEVDRWEVIIILAVTLITIFVNLVIAVG